MQMIKLLGQSGVFPIIITTVGLEPMGDLEKRCVEGRVGLDCRKMIKEILIESLLCILLVAVLMP